MLARRHAAAVEQQLARAARADAELVFLLADREARGAALDEERGDALVSRLGVDRGEDDEQVRLVAVGDPELLAVEDVVVTIRRRRGSCSAKASLPEPGLRQGVRADPRRGQLRQVALLLVGAAPAERAALMHERVLHVDEDADRGVDARQRLDAEHRVEERAPRATEPLGDLDAHDAEVEQLVDQRAWDLRVLVHVAHQRPDLRVGELAHAVAKEGFVFGKHGEGGHGDGSLLRHRTNSFDARGV